MLRAWAAAHGALFWDAITFSDAGPGSASATADDADELEEDFVDLAVIAPPSLGGAGQLEGAASGRAPAGAVVARQHCRTRRARSRPVVPQPEDVLDAADEAAAALGRGGGYAGPAEPLSGERESSLS